MEEFKAEIDRSWESAGCEEFQEGGVESRAGFDIEIKRKNLF